MSRVVQYAHKLKCIPNLNSYLSRLLGCEFSASFKQKPLVPRLKEDVVHKLFTTATNFGGVFPPRLAAHIDKLFLLVGDILRRSSGPGDCGDESLASLGERLLVAFQEKIDGYDPFFNQSQITPYLHILCAHMERVVDLHGGLGGYSSSIVETVNSLQTRKLILHTSKGGGKHNRHHFWLNVKVEEMIRKYLKHEGTFDSIKKNE